MRFEILDIVAFGQGLEAMVEIRPNWFEVLFGERVQTKKYYSQFGIAWYELPKFKELPPTNPISVELSREFLEQIIEFNRNLAMAAYQQTLDGQISSVKLLD